MGRFHRDKGQGYALLALKRLVDEEVNAHWCFVGVGQDIRRNEKLVFKLNLVDRVTFHQGVSSFEFRRFYRAAHIFVLPSVVSPNSHVETQ